MRISRSKQPEIQVIHWRLNNDKEIAIHELGKYTQGVIQETNDIWFLIGKYTLEEYLDIRNSYLENYL